MISQNIVRLLGYGGAVPFLGGAILLTSDSQLPGIETRTALLYYGAVILSFLGGLQWGRIASSTHHSRSSDTAFLVWSVVPPLIAWAALLAGEVAGVIVMIGCFCSAYIIDRRLCVAGEWQEWMGELRRNLTVAACVSLVLLLV